MHFESSRSEECLVHHVFSVCHADDEDVVEDVASVHLIEELIDDGVARPRAVPRRPALAADRVQLVDDDDVQAETVPGVCGDVMM